MSNRRRCCLFFVHCIRYALRNCCWNCIGEKYSQLLYLKDTIRKRVKDDLDIVEIIKKMRELRVIVDNSKITKNVKFKINHSYANVINLEDHEIAREQARNKMILVHDVDREDELHTQGGKRQDDPFEWGYSPFSHGTTKIDNKMTGAFNFKGAKIGPQNELEDYIRFKLTCKMFEYVRKMQKRVDARKGKSIN